MYILSFCSDSMVMNHGFEEVLMIQPGRSSGFRKSTKRHFE